VDGAVLVSTAAAAHITTNPTAPRVIRRASSVKYSSKIQTLSPMLVMGSTITRKGCDTLSGPTCSVACWSSSVASPAQASA
jgi:hypothetical protein